jgi:two-component system, cell cycle sensor histidine kinase DivJ
VSLLAQLSAYIESLVHPSARQDPLSLARQRAFIATRLAGGLLALTALPIHLAFNGVPGRLEIFIYAWLASPLLIAFYLSRTGAYGRAQVMSSAALSILIAAIGAATGGITSFAAVWLVAVPLEAALAASRRVVVAAAGLAMASAATLYLGGLLDVFTPVPQSVTLEALGIASAMLYALGLALAAASLTRASTRLRVAEEDRYRLLASNIADVITRHRRNGTVRFASPAAESLFGVAAKSLLGHGLFDRVHVADRPAYLTALANAATRGVGSSVEFRIRRDAPAETPDQPAQFIWVDMRCRPLEHTGIAGEAEHDVVAAIRDITERKTQEQTVDAAREDAERANAAKSRFLATMSHELRTPLNAIIGFSEMLANEEMMRLDKARRHEYATLIGESGHHLLSVVNGILDMSKIESGNFEITPEPFALGPAIASCCDLIVLRARESGIDVVHAAPSDLPDIVADKRAVKQILINLLSNAVKFTPRGGRVAVTVDLEPGHVIVNVKDTGVGIAEHDLQHVGDPFFQVRTAYDRPHDGTGLGLSIVKGLVALHGGELSIRSRVGAGTTVAVRLPLDCERTRPAAAPNVERLPTPDAARADESVVTVMKVRKRA